MINEWEACWAACRLADWAFGRRLSLPEGEPFDLMLLWALRVPRRIT